MKIFFFEKSFRKIFFEKFAGPWATGVFEKATSSTIDHKPGPLGHRALALGGIWEGDLLRFAAIFAYFYVAKNHLHFYSQNLKKNEGLGRPKWLQKLIFSSFGGHFLTIIFHITFCINFFSIFYRFLEAPALKNSNFPEGKP